MRIVSLLPSATEIVCALGLEADLVGVTHECDYPASVAAKPKVTVTHIPTDASSREIDRLVRGELEDRGALYTLDVDALASVAPDLIVSQTLCSVCAVADSDVQKALKRLPNKPRVLYLEPTTLEDVLGDIERVAAAAGVGPRGAAVKMSLRQRIERVKAEARERLQMQMGSSTLADSPRIKIHAPPTGRSAGHAGDAATGPDRFRPRVAVLEWLDPLFASGHWTPELVTLAGGREVLGQAGQRSREATWDELAAADPQVIVVACCGFNLERSVSETEAFLKDERASKLAAVRDRRVFVVDGAAYFSRPGPRLVDALEFLHRALDPHLRDPATAEFPVRRMP